MNRMSLVISATAALLVSACATTGPDPIPQATAQAETVRVEMMVNPADNGLTWAQIDLIASIADEYKSRGHGPLVISYPQNAANADAAIGAISEARTRLYEAGLDWRQIAGGAYEAGGRYHAPVVFSFTRYQAIAPECEERWPDLTNARPGRAWPQFGCATANNFAAMVSDPRDLIAPRTMEPSDNARRQTVLEGYRAGRSTASERSDNESGAVSSAVGN